MGPKRDKVAPGRLLTAVCTLYNLQIPYAAVVVLLPKEVHAEAVPVKCELHFTGTERNHFCEFCSNRILHYFPMLVSVSVTGVTSQVFSII